MVPQPSAQCVHISRSGRPTRPHARHSISSAGVSSSSSAARMCSRAADESARVSACASCIRARSDGAVITTPVTALAFSHQQFDATDRTAASKARSNHLPDHLNARRRDGFAVEEPTERRLFDAVATVPAAAVVDEQRPVDERAIGGGDVVNAVGVVGCEHPDLEWVFEVVQMRPAVSVDAEHASTRWDCVDTFFGEWCVDCHGCMRATRRACHSRRAPFCGLVGPQRRVTTIVLTCATPIKLFQRWNIYAVDEFEKGAEDG